MADCTYCGAETILQVNGVPVCVQCDKRLSEPDPETRKPPAREMQDPERSKKKEGR
jgi:hypothetical protein